ncbi:hypothetical protein BC937DRAFT_92707 [Endogone sp. FLAS-F59071]|nr:hypothetical protein BC937DRAFT_92707 [Endogone sp. FLAS-F59071]|eukprot:RUS21427.1 hypothetical protein BC937DRAFT_92707 [Endogone sp. FLAS-F59071]
MCQLGNTSRYSEERQHKPRRRNKRRRNRWIKKKNRHSNIDDLKVWGTPESASQKASNTAVNPPFNYTSADSLVYSSSCYSTSALRSIG